HNNRLNQLALVALAQRLVSLLARLGQRRQEYADQHGDDADDDEELDQREAARQRRAAARQSQTTSFPRPDVSSARHANTSARSELVQPGAALYGSAKKT